MFCKLIKRKKTPLYVELNRSTIKSIKETKKGKGLVFCKDSKDMFKKLGI